MATILGILEACLSMKKETSIEAESSNSLGPLQTTLTKKQTAKRSCKVYGKLDKALQLFSFEEELQLWREATKYDRRLQAQGEEIELMNPMPSTFPQKCLKEKAPFIFDQLSKAD